jgi:hypothetical protein
MQLVAFKPPVSAPPVTAYPLKVADGRYWSTSATARS